MARNVLIFMTDQQRGATVLPGHRLKAKTPRLDEFRREALTFGRSYTPSPHCCPSRASLFTGLYPSQHGVWNNVNLTNALTRGPREGTKFWFSGFQQAGYDLVFSGKWHVSNAQMPADLGWRELFMPQRSRPQPESWDAQRELARAMEIRKAWRNPRPGPEERAEGEIVRPGFPRYVHYGVDENPFSDGTVVEHAVNWIRDETPDATAPWMLYVGTLGPHDWYTPPQRFLDLYDIDDISLPDNFADPMNDKPALYRRTRDRFDQLTEREHREAIRHYLAFCTYEDHLFGLLLDALEAAGTYDDTVILYLSDHGDYAGDHGLWTKGLPAFESAYHIPTIIRWPDMPVDMRGRTNDAKVSLVDIGPTLADICEATPPAQMSGHSLRPWLDGTRTDDVRDTLFFQSNGNEAYGIQRIVMTDDWKLVCNFFDDDELYDLRSDPDEMTNLLGGTRAERRVGVGPLDIVPEHLRDVVRELYQQMWTNALKYDDEIFNNYIMTAISTFGPTIVAAPTEAQGTQAPVPLAATPTNP
ncbi:sulfatase-like hydrolase/transferase [Micromonospora coxensis]|uniref:Arylsulfatase A n=1 Tax=Micromonospora coxensis TaxID=356852 RepID=A0A1C5GVI4_9ACTN|nr:sulfatase-like hydrolase/transferase [Micromonospora coxensis]SCG37778.1 Arylsulfatase A [Micromonospora coxensis]